ncbi:MAG: YHYH protein [Lacinutrix sp.]|uniref:YHYH protein n=1 Tax=Lacinutrix sp. TaxID=1937692 RepID=UPI0030A3D396
MKKSNKNMYLFFVALTFSASILTFNACSSDDDITPVVAEEDEEVVTDDSGNTATLHDAFAEFDVDNTDIALSGSNVVVQTNGWTSHTSPYWSNTTSRTATPPGGTPITTVSATNHPLWVEPTATTHQFMSPGNIDDYNGTFTLSVSSSPALAATSTATGLGPIGISITGVVIYNDQEGPNMPLNDMTIGSFDYTAAHTGPQSYHYHLEPKAWSDDDDELVGIIADGFFIYGRKCNSTGTYPTDLDASGGHTSTTQHTTTAEYHYHIQNELYLNAYYILFPGDYQGTPSNIN